MQKKAKIYLEQLQQINVQSSERINNMLFNYNCTILLISKSRTYKGISDLGLYQFKNGKIKQISRLVHNLRVIYCTQRSNLFVSESKLLEYQFFKVWVNCSLNHTKFQNRIRKTGQEFCCTMNNVENLIIHSQDIFRSNKHPQTQEIIFYKKSKGGWQRIYIFYQSFYVEDLCFKIQSSDLMCCCSEFNKARYNLKILRTQNEIEWQVIQTIIIPNGLNKIYNLTNKILAAFNKFTFDINIYHLQDKNNQFKKIKTIKVPQNSNHQSEGNLHFSNELSLLLAYNSSSLNYIDINQTENQFIQQEIAISQQYFSGNSIITQEATYYITYIQKQQVIKIFKIQISN